jgi:hypothetical protein
MTVKNKDPYVLLTLYQNLYKQKYNKAVTINKFREKWAMQDVIDSVGFDQAYKLLNYYFGVSKSGHPLNFFFNNFDRMAYMMEAQFKDEERRRKLREATKRLVEGGEE